MLLELRECGASFFLVGSLLLRAELSALHGFSIEAMNFGKLLLSHEILINLCSQRATADVRESEPKLESRPPARLLTVQEVKNPQGS